MAESIFGFERDIHTTSAEQIDLVDILEAAEARSSTSEVVVKEYETQIEKQKRITVVALRLIQQKLEEQLNEINELKEKVELENTTIQALQNQIIELGAIPVVVG